MRIILLAASLALAGCGGPRVLCLEAGESVTLKPGENYVLNPPACNHYIGGTVETAGGGKPILFVTGPGR